MPNSSAQSSNQLDVLDLIDREPVVGLGEEHVEGQRRDDRRDVGRQEGHAGPGTPEEEVATAEGEGVMPMDETLGVVAVDFSGRAAWVVDAKVRTRLVGDLQSELVHDFFEGFARGARANVHAKILYGRSNHHKIEALFKAFGRALRVACSRDRRLAGVGFGLDEA